MMRRTDDTEENKNDLPPEADRLLFLPHDTELFLSLLHSLRCKHDLITDVHVRHEIVTRVLIPLSMQYLERSHGTAKALLEALRHVSKSGTSNNNNNNNRKIDRPTAFRRIVRAWCGLLTGTELAARRLVQQPHEDLQRVGRSLQQLFEAMVEECTCFLVDDLLVEQARTAVYLMRCPHLLSLSLLSTSSSTGDEEISTELADAACLSSSILRSCEEVRAVVVVPGTTEHDAGSSSVGADTIASVVRDKVCALFTQAVLDETQVFEIRLGGAHRFRRDVAHMVEALHGTHDPGCHRLTDMCNLMTLEWDGFRSLREVLCGLRTGALDDDDGGRRPLSVEDLEADAGVGNECRSMLAAKGFSSLELSDAVWIMNRRKE